MATYTKDQLISKYSESTYDTAVSLLASKASEAPSSLLTELSQAPLTTVADFTTISEAVAAFKQRVRIQKFIF